MYKLTFSFSLVCPLSNNFINALLSSGVPFKVKYSGTSMLIIIKPKYALSALNANFSLSSLPLPAPNFTNGGYLFSIS